jgi:hypothetical protein
MTAPGAGSGGTSGMGFDPATPSLPPTGGTTAGPGGMGGSMGSGGAGGGVKSQVREVKEQVVGQAKNVLGQARDSAASSLTESKRSLADQVASVATAVRGTTEHFRGQDQQRIAEWTDGLAGQADRFAGYLRDADFGAMRRDVENLARRQPGVVVGGAFLLGLLGARFLKSSERRQRTHDGNGDWNRGRSQFAGQGYGEPGYGGRRRVRGRLRLGLRHGWLRDRRLRGGRIRHRLRWHGGGRDR